MLNPPRVNNHVERERKWNRQCIVSIFGFARRKRQAMGKANDKREASEEERRGREVRKEREEEGEEK